jgi:hypothetical protein
MRRWAGISRCCSGRTTTDARGTSGHARARRRAGTSSCCSGLARTGARGARTRAWGRRWAASSSCCSGRARMAACGPGGRARTRRGAGPSRCCSGHARTAARGTKTRARSTGNSRCCNGLARTGARGARTRAWGRRWAASSSCRSGCAPTAARGTISRASSRQEKGTSSYYLGLARTAHPKSFGNTSYGTVHTSNPTAALLRVRPTRRCVFLFSLGVTRFPVQILPHHVSVLHRLFRRITSTFHTCSKKPTRLHLEDLSRLHLHLDSGTEMSTPSSCAPRPANFPRLHSRWRAVSTRHARDGYAREDGFEGGATFGAFR